MLRIHSLTQSEDTIMRNHETDQLAQQLNVAFKKSGMDVHTFVDYLEHTRDIIDVYESEERGQLGFFVYIPEYQGVAQFYFNHKTMKWFCKF